MSREKVLSLLLEQEGNYISGQQMSQSLGISRAAIWKAIEVLRQEGYVIETTPEQDDVIRNTFINISRDEEYQFLGNNCATTVVRSLNAAGIKTHSNETKTIHVPANHKLGESGFTVKIPKPKPLLPSSVFRTIMELNPKGVYLRKTY